MGKATYLCDARCPIARYNNPSEEFPRCIEGRHNHETSISLIRRNIDRDGVIESRLLRVSESKLKLSLRTIPPTHTDQKTISGRVDQKIERARYDFLILRRH